MLPQGKFPKLLIALALLVAALLILDLVAVRNSATRHLYSNALDFVMVFLAALASSYAARRSQGYARQLWTLLGIALFLEALAQAIITYYQRFVFFVWAAPVFMMFLPAADEKSRGWDWLRILDFGQIAIVAITAYLYFFYSPSRWLAGSSDLPRQILILYIVRDALLSAGFLFRSRNSSSPGLRSFSLGLFFVFLLAVLSDADFLVTLKTPLNAVSWGDFFFLLPWLAAIFLAALASSYAARRSQGYARQLWTLLGIALFLEALAQAIITYYQRFVLLETERALVHSEHLLSSAFRSSPDGFAINVFPDGPYLDVNEGRQRRVHSPYGLSPRGSPRQNSSPT